MLTIVEEDLNAKFASGLDPQTTLQLFGKWTHANWWLIEQLIIKLDTALESMQQGKPRLVTQAVVEQVQKVWLERSQQTFESIRSRHNLNIYTLKKMVLVLQGYLHQ